MRVGFLSSGKKLFLHSLGGWSLDHTHMLKWTSYCDKKIFGLLWFVQRLSVAMLDDCAVGPLEKKKVSKTGLKKHG